MAAFYIETVDDPLLTEICEVFSEGQNSYTRGKSPAGRSAADLTNVVLSTNGEISKRRGTRDVFCGFVSSENDRIQALCQLRDGHNQPLGCHRERRGEIFRRHGVAILLRRWHYQS